METFKYHDWVEWKFTKLTLVCCNRCGKVCKSDGSNAYDECKGKVQIAFRNDKGQPVLLSNPPTDPFLERLLKEEKPPVNIVAPEWQVKQFAMPSDVFRSEVLQKASNILEKANTDFLKKLFEATDKYLLDLAGHDPETFSKLTVQEKVDLAKTLQEHYDIEVKTSHSYDDPMCSPADPYVMTVTVNITAKEPK